MNGPSIKRLRPVDLRFDISDPWTAMVWIIAGMLLSATLPGCGGPHPVAGGTSGIVTIEEEPVLDMQVVVYSAVTQELIGFGITGDDGRFELVLSGASGPVTLEPGRYAATLESVGAPIELPPEYLDPQATPIQFDWQGSNEIDIDLSGVVAP